MSNEMQPPSEILPPSSRRDFLRLGTAALGLSVIPSAFSFGSGVDPSMTMDLDGGRIGVDVPLREAIQLAAQHGFESVAPDTAALADLSEAELQGVLQDLDANTLVFGAGGVPVDFRNDAATFRQGLERLPELTQGLERAGVTRVGTWIMPAHGTLTYRQNFEQHADRLRRIAEVLAEHNVRLGLEYVGTKTLWTSEKYPFIHTMAETKELIDAIGMPNVGFVLDSWHWHNAGETQEDILTLEDRDVVAVDLNDAPFGVATDELNDASRELPMTTGVIDMAAFLEGLVRIGYTGPARAEPFNEMVNNLPPEEAVAVTADAMKEAFALIR
jgi:sugar phosphate isomerase/epimerase